MAEKYVFGQKDFLHFVRTANGSLAEVETQILIARDLYAVDVADLLIDTNEVSKIMNGLISSLSSSATESSS